MNKLFENIKETRKTRIIYISDKYILKEGVKENTIKIPSEAAYIILNINNTKLIFENKNISFKVPVDANNRLISFDLNGVGMKMNLKDSYLTYQMIGDEETGYFISITELKYGKDILINSEEELYEYPLIETKIEQTNENYKGYLYCTLAPLGDKIKLLETSGNYLEVSSDLNHYVLKCKTYSAMLSLIYCENNDSYLLLTSEGCFKVHGISENGILVRAIDDDPDKEPLVILFKYLFDVRRVDFIQSSYIYNYKDKWYNCDKLDDSVKDFLNSSIISDWLLVSDIIKENYNANNYNIINDFKDEYKDLCNKIIKSKVLDIDDNGIVFIDTDNTYSTFSKYMFESYDNYIKFIFKNIKK